MRRPRSGSRWPLDNALGAWHWYADERLSCPTNSGNPALPRWSRATLLGVLPIGPKDAAEDERAFRSGVHQVTLSTNVTVCGALAMFGACTVTVKTYVLFAWSAGAVAVLIVIDSTPVA